MRNCKKEILTALIAKLKTAMPTMKVRTKINDFNISDNTAYPYVYVSDLYQTEIGPKNYHAYDVDVLIQIVYKDLTSLGNLYDAQNSVLGLFKIPESLTLTNNFTVQETILLSSTETEIQVDTGTLNIGLIRIKYTVEDKKELVVTP